MELEEVRYDKRLPTIQISQEMLNELESAKQKTGKSYGEIVRMALREHLSKKKKTKES